MPKVLPKEKKDDFVARCIPYVMKEGLKQDAAVAKCYGIWNSRNSKEGTEMNDSTLFSLATIPITEAVVHDDRTATVTIIESGWSINKNFYSPNVIESLGKHLIERPKLFVNHVYDKKKALNRPVEDWAATVVKEWTVHEGGRSVKKAKIEFTHLPIGEALYQQAKATPSLLGLSINAMVRGRKGEAKGQKGLIVEGWEFLFSTDFVSYASAKGKVDSATVNESDGGIDDLFSEDDNSELVESWLTAEGLDTHGIWEKNMKEKEKQEVKDEKVGVLEQMLSLSDYIKQQKIKEYLNDLWWGFQDQCREVRRNATLTQEQKAAQLQNLFNEFITLFKSVNAIQLAAQADNSAEAIPEGQILPLWEQFLEIELKTFAEFTSTDKMLSDYLSEIWTIFRRAFFATLRDTTKDEVTRSAQMKTLAQDIGSKLLSIDYTSVVKSLPTTANQGYNQTAGNIDQTDTRPPTGPPIGSTDSRPADAAAMALAGTEKGGEKGERVSEESGDSLNDMFVDDAEGGKDNMTLDELKKDANLIEEVTKYLVEEGKVVSAEDHKTLKDSSKKLLDIEMSRKRREVFEEISKSEKFSSEYAPKEWYESAIESLEINLEDDRDFRAKVTEAIKSREKEVLEIVKLIGKATASVKEEATEPEGEGEGETEEPEPEADFTKAIVAAAQQVVNKGKEKTNKKEEPKFTTEGAAKLFGNNGSASSGNGETTAESAAGILK